MRRRLGMNQRELAKGIGVSPSFIGEIETDGKAVSTKVEQGILRLLAENGIGRSLPNGDNHVARRPKESANEPPSHPSPVHGAGGDAMGQARPGLASPPSGDDLLRHVIVELTAHLRRMDENDKLRIETVQAPEARAREAAESNIKTMLGMLSSSQESGRQGPDDGPPQGPTTGTDNE